MLRLTLALLLLLAALPAAAQADDPPLVILMDGDLWAWTEAAGALSQLTEGAQAAAPRISPDGTRIAYRAISPAGLAALEREPSVGTPPPDDLFVMDPHTAEVIQVAAQPQDVAFNVPGQPNTFILRSDPAWGPGGAALAWAELSFPDFSHRLMLHDLTSGTTTALAALPDPAIGPGPASVLWVGGRIAAWMTFNDPAADALAEALLTFSAGGLSLAQVTLPRAVDGADFVVGIYPVRADEVDYAGLAYASGRWELASPETGAVQTPRAAPTWGGPSAELTGIPYEDPLYGVLYRWALDGEPLPYEGWPDGIALAPGGDGLAYIGAEGIYRWRDGEADLIPETGRAGQTYAALAWSPPLLTARIGVG